MSLYCGPPKFFKVIQNHELQNGELRVPKKFVEKYWEGIPNPVVITLPNGLQHDLFWVKRDGDIFFRKNWKKIAKFLKFGYGVVFKYVGGSCFHLDIFGLNSVEIDYSKFIDEVSDETDEFVELSEDETNIAATSRRTKRKSSKKNMNNGKGNKRGVSIYPSFDLKLTQTYAQGYLFRIPSEFSRRYIRDFDGKARIRKVGDDRTWKVEVKYDRQGKHDYSVVKSGWKPFAMEYNLQTGDVCKFEMTRSEPLSFTVTIIRAPKRNQGFSFSF